MSVEKVDIVLQRDKNGNVIYPVTTEDAVILRDGSYLSDKLDTLKVAENVSGKVNAVIREVQNTLSEIDEITEDTLVFDDELVTSELEVHDVTELLNSIETKMQILYRLAVIADEDEEISLLIEKTILEALAQINVEIEMLKNALSNIEEECPDNIIVYDDDDEYAPDGVILTGELSEELIKLNSKINNFKINCETTSKNYYDSIASDLYINPSEGEKEFRFFTKEETYTRDEINDLIQKAITNSDSSLLDIFYDKKQIEELLTHKAPLSHSHDTIYINEGQDVPAKTIKFEDKDHLQYKYDNNSLVDHEYFEDKFIGTMDSTLGIMEIDHDQDKVYPMTDRDSYVTKANNIIENEIIPTQSLAILGDDITLANRRFVKYYDYVKNDLHLKNIELHCTRFGTITKIKSMENKCILNNISDISEDIDIILVLAGTNDAIYSAGIGSINSKEVDTVYGALHDMCNKLLTKFPDKLIIFVTPTNTRDKDLNVIAKAIKDVCFVYSIPVYDNHRLAGIYPKINGTLDGIHWNENTHKKVGKRLSKFIDTLNY